MIHAKKSLGQNFLTDKNIARKIVDSVKLTDQDVVLEIGPGQGALTRLLLESAATVIAVEIDPRCADQLGEEFEGNLGSTLHLVRSDILKTDFESLLSEAGVPPELKVRVVANLPYNISSPVIQHLLENHRFISDMTLMLQKEVVERIASAPGTKEYGSLSVFVQYYAEVKKVFDVPPNAFKPMPKVTSTVVRLNIREKPAVTVSDARLFFQVVRTAFAQRRKTIANNLRSLIGDQSVVVKLLDEARIEPKRRAETLSLDEFAAVANHLAIQRS
ncbi:MAG TPA: 16S rRNA (adenine(1518)-N(6)/adenine(1519)-N(6))-dimethyltransferase RsmA [Blastocatellia bacterium]|nr:16S rRNA (adenine(1518)-N(6)/adenine(1519)-N(6))-dimethyltransferase RsmA [Blastocatellia bacterium]